VDFGHFRCAAAAGSDEIGDFDVLIRSHGDSLGEPFDIAEWSGIIVHADIEWMLGAVDEDQFGGIGSTDTQDVRKFSADQDIGGCRADEQIKEGDSEEEQVGEECGVCDAAIDSGEQHGECEGCGNEQEPP
jgi:hypothetical protein